MHNMLRFRHVTVSIALVVALGIGANVAVFTVLRHAVIGDLPYADAARLVVLENRGAYDLGVAKVSSANLSWPDFRDFAAELHVFSAVGGVTGGERVAWDADTRLRSVQRVFVTRDLFKALQAIPRAGRILAEADFEAGSPSVIIVTASLWRSQLGADAAAIGRVVHIDNHTYTVVGIVDDDVLMSLRERKTVFERGEDTGCLIMPVVPAGGSGQERLLEFRRQNGNLPALTVVGRVKAGIPLHAAQREVQALAERLAQQYPDSNRGRTIDALPLSEWRTREVRHFQPLLLAVAVLAWLAACASAAGLVLADAIRRGPEMAVRHALGASRRTLTGLIVRRSLRWTIPGGLLGLGLAWLIGQWIGRGTNQAHLPADTTEPATIALAAALTVLAGLLLGGIAAWVSFGQNLALGLKEAPQTSLATRGRQVILATVVTLQITATVSLGLVCALFIRSMVNIVGVDVGFEKGRTFIVRVFVPRDTGNSQSTFFDAALNRIRSLPDVQSAGYSNTPPLSRVVVTSGGDYALESPGRPAESLGPLVTQYVSPEYFESIGMRISRGRGFSAKDYGEASPVIVVDEAFGRQHFRGADPLNGGVRMDGVLFRIVGVAHDVHPDGPTADVRPTLYVLRDKRQPAQSIGHFVVRSSRAITQQLMSDVVQSIVPLDRRVVVDEPQTLDTLFADTLADRQRTLRILALAACLVFLLTTFSISGALSEFVANKTRELALRKALGASTRHTALMLAKHLAHPCLLGVAFGGVAGWSLARILSSQLFGVAPTDVVTAAATLACLSAAVVIAAVGPLARAVAIEPARALRSL